MQQFLITANRLALRAQTVVLRARVFWASPIGSRENSRSAIFIPADGDATDLLLSITNAGLRGTKLSSHSCLFKLPFKPEREIIRIRDFGMDGSIKELNPGQSVTFLLIKVSEAPLLVRSLKVRWGEQLRVFFAIVQVRDQEGNFYTASISLRDRLRLAKTSQVDQKASSSE